MHTGKNQKQTNQTCAFLFSLKLKKKEENTPALSFPKKKLGCKCCQACTSSSTPHCPSKPEGQRSMQNQLPRDTKHNFHWRDPRDNNNVVFKCYAVTLQIRTQQTPLKAGQTGRCYESHNQSSQQATVGLAAASYPRLLSARCPVLPIVVGATASYE